MVSLQLLGLFTLSLCVLLDIPLCMLTSNMIPNSKYIWAKHLHLMVLWCMTSCKVVLCHIPLVALDVNEATFSNYACAGVSHEQLDSSSFQKLWVLPPIMSTPSESGMDDPISTWMELVWAVARLHGLDLSHNRSGRYNAYRWGSDSLPQASHKLDTPHSGRGTRRQWIHLAAICTPQTVSSQI